jgi:hypothetical protein
MERFMERFMERIKDRVTLISERTAGWGAWIPS